MTLSRIARVLTVGATLGAAYRLHEEPHSPGKFWHLVTCALVTYPAISTPHRGEPPPAQSPRNRRILPRRPNGTPRLPLRNHRQQRNLDRRRTRVGLLRLRQQPKRRFVAPGEPPPPHG